MPLILSPLTYRLRKKVGFTRSIQEVSSEIVVVAAEETSSRRRSISLPLQFERVRAVQPTSTMELEHARMLEGEVRHAATRAILIRDAWYLDGVLYAKGAHLPQVTHRETLITLGNVPKIGRASLPSSWVGSKFFGHHVVDDSATSLLAAEFGPVFRAPSRDAERWSHAKSYRIRLGVEAPVLNRAHIKEAWVMEDVGMNVNRRGRLMKLRERLRDSPSNRRGHGVFLRRRGGGALRNLINEEEIELFLSSLGFDIIDPSNDSLDEIIFRCQNAAIIAGVEGSSFAHGLLNCAPNATLLMLQHPYQFTNLWKDFTDAMGLKYAFIVGEGNRDAFRINPDEVCATLELL